MGACSSSDGNAVSEQLIPPDTELLDLCSLAVDDLLRDEVFAMICRRAEDHPREARQWDSHRRLPIHMLCSLEGMWNEGSRDAVRALSRAYPKGLTVADRSKDTPLHLACRTQGWRVAQVVFDANRSVAKMEGKNQQLPLHIVCQRFIGSNHGHWLQLAYEMLMEFPEAAYARDDCGNDGSNETGTANANNTNNTNNDNGDQGDNSNDNDDNNTDNIKEEDANKFTPMKRVWNYQLNESPPIDQAMMMDRLEYTQSCVEKSYQIAMLFVIFASTYMEQRQTNVDKISSSKQNQELDDGGGSMSTHATSSTGTATERSSPFTRTIKKTLLKDLVDAEQCKLKETSPAMSTILLSLAKAGGICQIPAPVCRAIVDRYQSQILIADAKSGLLPSQVLKRNLRTFASEDGRSIVECMERYQRGVVHQIIRTPFDAAASGGEKSAALKPEASKHDGSSSMTLTVDSEGA
mmetsp:Transcript_7112/g.20963  ORF Transcript_7112/g.20963 Transcript_7112/m.20963 type:complete len:464 (+) Transcript_7112:286-1677(+)